MKHLIRLLAATALLLLVVLPAFAQGTLIYEDEVGNLSRRDIERAAQPLIDRGAVVAIYNVRSGGSSDFEQRLRADNLLSSDGRLRRGLIAIYVSSDPRFSSIRFEDQWNEALASQDNYEDIRRGQLNAGLAGGNYTQGFADTLSAIDDAIQNPPGNPIVDTLPIAVAGVGLAGAAVAGVAVTRRRRAKKALADARQRADEARKGAGGLIAGLGQRLNTTQEKAKFDRVSYPPAEVDALAKAQREFEQGFVAAQTRFDDIGEALAQRANPTVAQYDEVTQSYTQLQQQLEGLRGKLDTIDARRAELDKLAKQAPGEIDRAKKS